MQGNIISVGIRDDKIVTKYLAVKDGRTVLTEDRERAVLVPKETADKIVGSSGRPLAFVARRK